SDVLDIELLPERFAEFLSRNPREDIGASAGREWHNHAHCTRRIGLRPREARDGRQRGSARGQMQKISAGEVHFEPPSRFTSLDHFVGEQQYRVLVSPPIRATCKSTAVRSSTRGVLIVT